MGMIPSLNLSDSSPGDAISDARINFFTGAFGGTGSVNGASGLASFFGVSDPAFKWALVGVGLVALVAMTGKRR